MTPRVKGRAPVPFAPADSLKQRYQPRDRMAQAPDVQVCPRCDRMHWHPMGDRVCVGCQMRGST